MNSYILYANKDELLILGAQIFIWVWIPLSKFTFSLHFAFQGKTLSDFNLTISFLRTATFPYTCLGCLQGLQSALHVAELIGGHIILLCQALNYSTWTSIFANVFQLICMYVYVFFYACVLKAR